MANYFPVRMKRKDLDDIYGDFSDLSLSAPATKIRRLDADLLRTAEEMDLFTPSMFGQPMPEEETSTAVMNRESITGGAVLPRTLREERALVVYKPPDFQFAPSFKINPKLISGLKNYTFWPRNPNIVEVLEEYGEDKESSSDNCFAIVPWVPSPVLAASQAKEVLASGNELDEPMEAEGAAATFMEIEEDKGQAGNFGVGGHGFQQWQQHCMIPQLLQSNSTPIIRS